MNKNKQLMPSHLHFYDKRKDIYNGKEKYQHHNPHIKFSTQRRCICSRETEGRDKGQRQEIEEEREWEGYQGKLEEIFVPE